MQYTGHPRFNRASMLLRILSPPLSVFSSRHLPLSAQRNCDHPHLPMVKNRSSAWARSVHHVLRAAVVLTLVLILAALSYFSMVGLPKPLPSPTPNSTTGAPSVVETTGAPIAQVASRANYVKPRDTTLVFRRPGDEIDCTLVYASLRQLYAESQVRQAAWREAGFDLTAEHPRGLNVTELHLLLVGDSWAQRQAQSIVRHLDACRMLSPEPLIDRDECVIQYLPRSDSQSIFQLSKAALGLDAVSGGSDGAEFLRIHIHYRRRRYFGDAAAYLETVLRSPGPSPSITTLTFPHEAQCRRSSEEAIVGMENQVPLCLCEDGVNFPRESLRRVPVAAIQVFNGMWHTQLPTVLDDLFAFKDRRVDWFLRQARFSPDLTVYPYITWEENLVRLRHFHTNTYVAFMRKAVAGAAASAQVGVPMPRMLLSRIPRVYCNAPKFKRLPTLNTSTRCEELAWPLHDVVDDAVRAAYGEAVLGLPAVEAPDWLRMVNYRPLSATEYPQYRYNYRGEPLDGGEYLCTMSDGAHFDTFITFLTNRAPLLWCARHSHRLFWEQMVQ